MKTLSVISLLMLAVTVQGACAQDVSRAPEPTLHRPLNLSVRKSVAPAVDPTVLPVGDESRLAAQTPSASVGTEVLGTAPTAMPYGAGYETRQQSAMVAGRGPGRGPGGNGTGSGPGGGGGASGGSGGGGGGGAGGHGGRGH